MKNIDFFFKMFLIKKNVLVGALYPTRRDSLKSAFHVLTLLVLCQLEIYFFFKIKKKQNKKTAD